MTQINLIAIFGVLILFVGTPTNVAGAPESAADVKEGPVVSKLPTEYEKFFLYTTRPVLNWPAKIQIKSVRWWGGNGKYNEKPLGTIIGDCGSLERCAPIDGYDHSKWGDPDGDVNTPNRLDIRYTCLEGLYWPPDFPPPPPPIPANVGVFGFSYEQAKDRGKHIFVALDCLEKDRMDDFVVVIVDAGYFGNDAERIDLTGYLGRECNGSPKCDVYKNFGDIVGHPNGPPSLGVMWDCVKRGENQRHWLGFQPDTTGKTRVALTCP